MIGIQRKMSGEECNAYIAIGGRKGGDDDLVHDHGVKWSSALNNLPYWIVSLDPYNSVERDRQP